MLECLHMCKRTAQILAQKLSLVDYVMSENESAICYAWQISVL